MGNFESRIFLGLETGGTKIVASAANRQGEILATLTRARPPDARAPETLQALIHLGEQVLSALPGKRPAAVGLGFGGTVDRRRNEPDVNLHEPGWETIEAAARLRQHFQSPVFCENDCNAAALAEALAGAGTPQGVTFYITVGSGIGGGIIHNGRILECSPWGEAEIGHLVVDESGPLCPCGNRGCLEACCSGWGLAEMAGSLAPSLSEKSALAGKIDSLPREDVARALFAAYPGDVLAEQCVERLCRLMGRACAIVINLLTPKVIVLGGGVMQNSWLPERIQQQAERQVAPHLRQPCLFRAAGLGEQAVSLGAIFYAIQRLEGGSG